MIRKRAAIIGRENEMVITPAEVNIDFILAERARELAGEDTRWIDLKRTGKLTRVYFQSTNPSVALNFNEKKHVVRPIPQSFLDAIINGNEFGNNGY